MILTNAEGRPFLKPERAGYPTLVDYVRAVHEFNDRVTADANSAFDRQWIKALNA